jgi:hypothetical protein
MQWWFQELSTGMLGENPPVATVNIPSTDVLAFCSLQQVGQAPAAGLLVRPPFGNAEVFISQYVADGVPHEGNWPLIGANDVTSISVTLSANGSVTKGLLLILAINE